MSAPDKGWTDKNGQKRGRGPNDHKKGNRTRGADRSPNCAMKSVTAEGTIKALKKNAAALAESTEHYRKIAEQRKGRIKYGVEFTATLRDRLTKYIEDQQAARKPLTIAGCILAAQVDPDTWRRWRNEERDYLLFEYMTINGIDFSEEGNEIIDQNGDVILLARFSTLVKMAELSIQEQLETNCYTNKGNPAGSIFGLKARYDWQDQPAESKTTNNNTLVLNNVANLDEAKDALKRLGG